jgi:hypothetical protein
MAKKNYIVVTPLRTGTDEEGKPQIVDPGKPVTLDEKEAKPLLDVGAIREQDVIEDEKKGAAKK